MVKPSMSGTLLAMFDTLQFVVKVQWVQLQEKRPGTEVHLFRVGAIESDDKLKCIEHRVTKLQGAGSGPYNRWRAIGAYERSRTNTCRFMSMSVRSAIRD